MLLACLVQWPFLKGRSVYRVLLMIPCAVPSFISILVFKGFFNQHFGEVNIFLKMIMEPALAMVGIQWQTPDWFSDPHLARVMLLLVNAWLGYPYMMILCMGLSSRSQAIPTRPAPSKAQALDRTCATSPCPCS